MNSELDTASTFAKFAQFFKSVPNDKLQDMTDVLDQWSPADGLHGNPSRAEIVTGPAQAASGAGAVRMVTDYSDPAPQQGLTQQYAEFQRMLNEFGKSLTNQINPILARHDQALGALMGVFGEARKALPATDTYLGKALSKLSKAKSELRRADLADEDEADKRAEHVAAADDCLKAAKRLLARKRAKSWRKPATMRKVKVSRRR